MMNLIAILLASLSTQDVRTIVRQEKGDYNVAVARYREAEAMIESDPQAAVEKLTEIIGNGKLRAMECILKIEQRPGDYSEHPFFPFQSRGHARVNLSKKASAEAAPKLLQAAIDDYQESVKRNVPTSAEPLKNAQAALIKLKTDVAKPPDPVKADPVAAFREKWIPLLQRNRFRAAKELIAKDSEGVSEELKKEFLRNTEQGCRDLLTNWVSEFRPNFIRAMNLGLEQKTTDEFELLFKLPAMDELVVSHPALDWARQYQPAFREVQSQKAPVYTLAAAAAASAPLEERNENPWFRAIEAAVFASLRSGISAEVENARDATKAAREKARAQADGLLAQWKMFMGKLDAKFVERHGHFLPDHERQLVKLFEGFPAELADLDKIDPAVEAAFGAESPDAALAKIEESLSLLESRGNLTLESRQRLYTVRVVVVALRGLFNGKTEDAVAVELAPFRQKLREAGGPAGDVKKYGPRVEKVFADLR